MLTPGCWKEGIKRAELVVSLCQINDLNYNYINQAHISLQVDLMGNMALLPILYLFKLVTSTYYTIYTLLLSCK